MSVDCVNGRLCERGSCPFSCACCAGVDPTPVSGLRGRAREGEAVALCQTCKVGQASLGGLPWQQRMFWQQQTRGEVASCRLLEGEMGVEMALGASVAPL